MNRRRRGALAASTAWAVVAVIDFAGLALTVTSALRRVAGPSAEDIFLPLAMTLVSMAFATVGWLVATRRPGNAVVWPLYLLAFALAAVVLAEGSLGVGGGVWLAWLASWAIDPPMYAGLVFLLLLFPDGRLPSPRWRLVAWLAAVCIAGLALVYAFKPGPLWSDETTLNPLGVEVAAGLASVADALFVAWLAALLASVGGLAVRYRRAGAEQRQQLKWLAAAGMVVGLAFLLGPVIWSSGLPEIVWHLTFAMGMGAFPVAAGIAILRHRLYDIDRIISRTLAYALVTAALAGLYALGVLVLAQLFAPLAPDSQLAVAGSTLAVVAAFGPLRRRVQAAVDRRFNRQQYDSARMIEAFRSRLRQEVNLDELSKDLLAVVGQTVEPARASLWLRTSGPRR